MQVLPEYSAPRKVPLSTTGPNNPLKGIVLLLVAMTILPGMEGIAKLLLPRYPVVEVVWGRYFFHFLVLLPVVLIRYGAPALRPRQLGVQVVRGGFLMLATLFFISAINVMPMADALALSFISPLVVVALSPLLLGERVGLRRWSAVAVGFCGVLVIVRPGLIELNTGALFAIASGLVYGLFTLATRRVAGTSEPLVTLVFTALVGAVALSCVMPFVWVPPTFTDVLLMAAQGMVAASGHFLIIRAYEQAPASLLAPFTYSRIISISVLAYIAFGEIPDRWTWAGVAILAASGIYISIRERQRGAPLSAESR